MEPRFPPPLAIGVRVWTEDGYRDHGPLDGPKVNVPPQTGGIVARAEAVAGTDESLYSARWDNGLESKHYGSDLFSIGRFETRDEFEAAIRFEDVQLTLGPQGGFREVQMRIVFDGAAAEGRLDKRGHGLWADFLEPIARRQGVEIRTVRVPRATRRKA